MSSLNQIDFNNPSSCCCKNSAQKTTSHHKKTKNRYSSSLSRLPPPVPLSSLSSLPSPKDPLPPVSSLSLLPSPSLSRITQPLGKAKRKASDNESSHTSHKRRKVDNSSTFPYSSLASLPRPS